MNGIDFAPLAFEKSLIGGLILLYASVLARRTFEVLTDRFKLGGLARFALMLVILCAYLAVPVGLKLPEHFAPLMTPFSDLLLCVILFFGSLAGALGLYVLLGGKLPGNRERYP